MRRCRSFALSKPTGRVQLEGLRNVRYWRKADILLCGNESTILALVRVEGTDRLSLRLTKSCRDSVCEGI